MVASVVIALLGIALAYLFYVKNPALPGRFTARFVRPLPLGVQQIFRR